MPKKTHKARVAEIALEPLPTLEQLMKRTEQLRAQNRALRKQLQKRRAEAQ